MKKSIIVFSLFCGLSFVSCEKSDEVITQNLVEADAKANLPESVARKTYALEEESSVVEWRGHAPGTSHNGSFSVNGQDIEVVNGKVKEGRFIIPIASIQNFDLPDNIKPVLLDHLKSPDFFNMVKYPEASFEFKKVTPLTKAVAGSVAGANYLAEGDFSMLGKTVSISFPARIVFEGDQLAIEATFKIDRTKWGMTYGADPALGDHQIFPEVDLHLKLKGNKQ